MASHKIFAVFVVCNFVFAGNSLALLPPSISETNGSIPELAQPDVVKNEEDVLKEAGDLALRGEYAILLIMYQRYAVNTGIEAKFSELFENILNKDGGYKIPTDSQKYAIKMTVETKKDELHSKDYALKEHPYIPREAIERRTEFKTAHPAQQAPAVKRGVETNKMEAPADLQNPEVQKAFISMLKNQDYNQEIKLAVAEILRTVFSIHLLSKGNISSLLEAYDKNAANARIEAELSALIYDILGDSGYYTLTPSQKDAIEFHIESTKLEYARNIKEQTPPAQTSQGKLGVLADKTAAADLRSPEFQKALVAVLQDRIFSDRAKLAVAKILKTVLRRNIRLTVDIYKLQMAYERNLSAADIRGELNGVFAHILKNSEAYKLTSSHVEAIKSQIDSASLVFAAKKVISTAQGTEFSAL